MTAQTYTDAQKLFALDAMCAAGYVSEDRIAQAVAIYDSLPRQAAHCPYCDDTGDVHGIDGEWRGECTSCKASQAARIVVVSDEDDERAFQAMQIVLRDHYGSHGVPLSDSAKKLSLKVARAALESFAHSHGVAGAGDAQVVYEIFQDDMCVAGSDSFSDALHYVALYSQDGPVELRKVTSYSQVIDAATQEKAS